jgi:hypothetical protein
MTDGHRPDKLSGRVSKPQILSLPFTTALRRETEGEMTAIVRYSAANRDRIHGYFQYIAQ